ncbi:MAG: response regulator [Bdellovibrionales bacterium]|nr:response regulator [Bdellovibrionales bacterium]
MESTTTILVADDEATSRLLLKSILEGEGYSVIEAVDGQDALEKIELSKPDIAVLDLLMPKLDGLNVCKELRKKFDIIELPIVMVTAANETDSLIKCLSQGANDFISKPVNKDILLARLNNIVMALQSRLALIEAHKEAARRQRMETVGQFAAGVAHNFNNVLGVIMGNAELLIEDLHKARMSAESAAMILDSSRKAAILTESLLTFTGTHGHKNCKDPLKAAESLLPLAKAFSGTRVTYELTCTERPGSVVISSSDLVSVLLQLVRNGIEAIADSGSVQIEIKTVEIENQKQVRFRVSDTGTGMPEHLIEHAFEPFYSSKNVGVRGGISFDGSGLGLSLAYNLVSSAGGYIRVVRSGKNGTVIEFVVPCAESDS